MSVPILLLTLLMTAPQTRTLDTKEILFGVSVPDPYRWLEDEKSPEVKAWMTAQDKAARAHIDALPGRAKLIERFKQLYYLDSVSPPWRRGSRLFYTRRHADREKAIVYFREGSDGGEQLLLDPNAMSKDGTTSLGTWVPSLDGEYVAYALRENGSDEAALHVMDVVTRKESPIDRIAGAKYAQPSWLPDSSGFYYTWLPADPVIAVADRPGYAEVRFHRIGTDPKNDALIHAATRDPKSFLGASVSRDGRWLLCDIQHGWNSTDVYLRDLSRHASQWKPIAVGLDAQFNVFAWKGFLYLHTNLGAPHWRVFRVSADDPGRANWKEVIAERHDGVLQGVGIANDQLALHWLVNVESALELRDLDGSHSRMVKMPGIGVSMGIHGDPEGDDAYYDFSSPTTPPIIQSFSVTTLAQSLWAKVEVPVDPAPFLVEQVFYPSKDGTKISMFVVRRRDMPKDGTTPFLLYGYGGFNVSLEPSFMSSIYPWLEAGGGFAMPNLRGGGEYGEEWHRAGMGANKHHVFEDFIAAAQWLITQRYTSAPKLAIRGGSNGGLLVGAAMTQRPDLFRAVICAVPLLDMVRYHLFGSGKTWIPEYGSAETEDGFKVLHAYSPYHHIVAGTKYPALLMMSADSDDRVDPMHARKFTAAIQAASTSGHAVLLRIEAHAGHGGADLVKQAVESSADAMAFLMAELGM